MVRMTVLASGSKGNSTVVSSTRTRILVDAGMSCREIFKRMRSVGEDPETLDAIIITHEHQDHVQGLQVTARKLGIPVYFTEATHRAWMRWMAPQKRVTYADWLAARDAEKRRVAEGLPDPEDDLCADSDTATGAAARAPKTAEELTRLPGVEYFRAGEAF